MFALLVLAALPTTARAEDVRELAVGQSVFVTSSARDNVGFENSAPTVVSFSPIYQRSIAGVQVWGYVQALSPGVATITFYRISGNQTTIVPYKFVVEGCDAFPKIPPLRVVPGQARTSERVDSRAILAVEQAHFDWYEGSIGDFRRPLTSSNTYYVLFTPAEAKQYHLWYRVFDECATKEGELIVDATVSPRRHATRR